MDPAPSPLRGRYLVRNRLLNAALRGLDRLLAPLAGRAAAIAPPRSVLVANIAHLGDALLSTGALAALRAAFPGARLGFLAGSWSRPLLDGHPLVDRLHTFDHFRLNRSATSLVEKVRRHAASRRAAVAEVRAAGYDVAVDLYPYFPNAAPLLWSAGVPVRVGYTSGGFGALLTHPVEWPLRDWHVTGYHAHLLARLPLPGRPDAPLTPVLPDDAPPGGLPTRYAVLHPGAGAGFKEWPAEGWRAVVAGLGLPVVLTGSGDRERAACAAVAAGTGCLDLCGRLSWREFVAVVRRAALLLGVDSVAGHVAAAVGTPCVVVATGIPHPEHWTPLGPAVRVLRAPVACSPCYRSRGCADMACVRGVRPEEVLAAARSFSPRPVGERG